jgi:hypothetical protein
MHRIVIVAAVMLLGVAGCAPSPPKPEELGRIVYEPRQIPGMDNPYEVPEVETGKEKSNDEKPAATDADTETP